MLYFSPVPSRAPNNITFSEVRETPFKVTWDPLPQQFHNGSYWAIQFTSGGAPIFQYHLIQAV